MLWRRRVTALSSEFPDIELSHMYVDNAAMQLVRNPKQVCLFSCVIHCALAIICFPVCGVASWPN